MHIAKERVAGNVHGRVELGRFYERGERGLFLPTCRKSNQLQYTWGHIAARQIGYRRAAHRLDYSISAMYFEFENVASPEDPVTIPESFGRDEDIDYYNGLISSGVRDFVRVPLRMEPALAIAAGFEDYFTDGEDGNELTFIGITSGTTGVHGRTFSHVVNSKICGLALVAAPVMGDRTLDVVFARTYFEAAGQQIKEASAQGYGTWLVSFE